MKKKDNNIKILENGWMDVPFSYIAENISKRVDPKDTDLDVYIGLEHLDPGSLKINRYGSPEDVKGVKLTAKDGDVIFGKRRAYQGKVGICEWDAIVSAHSMILREREEHFEKRLLGYFMQGDEFYNRSIQISEGSLSPTIKWKVLAEQKFTIPPREQQKQILKKLNTIETSIVSKIKLLDKTLKYKEKLLITIIEGNFIGTSKNWGKRRLKDLICESCSGIWGETPTEKSKYGVLRSTNVTNYGKFDFKDVAYRKLPKNKLEKMELKKDDILIEKSGGSPAQPVGRVCYYSGERSETYLTHGNFMQRLRVNKEIVLPKLVFYILYQLHFLGTTIKYQQATTGIRNLMLTEYLNLKVLIPNDKVEQIKIIEKINKIEYTLDSLKEEIRILSDLKKVMINDFFDFKN